MFLFPLSPLIPLLPLPPPLCQVCLIVFFCWSLSSSFCRVADAAPIVIRADEFYTCMADRIAWNSFSSFHLLSSIVSLKSALAHATFFITVFHMYFQKRHYGQILSV